MKKPTRRVLEVIFPVSTALVLVLATAQSAVAQVTAGNNAVYNSTGLTGSAAFIDAKAYANGTGDICDAIHNILVDASYPAAGAVIDARGILPSSNQYYGPQKCASNPFTANKPSTVLLPESTLFLAVPWVLPSNTRIIGGGQNSVLRACWGNDPSGFCSADFPTGGDMIDMGSPSCTPCSGISLEHIQLDGNGGHAISDNGIVNQYAQESSYTNDVDLQNILLTGLSVVGPGANGSGPYANLLYSCPQCTASPSACISVTATTLGLHGITCTANSNTGSQPPAAILLDASNNSIENVHIEGFYDGVLIGSRGSAEGNLLLNVYGGFGSGPLKNTVHISNLAGPVTDLALLQIESIGAQVFPAAPIRDDVNGTQPINYAAANAYVGMYAIGNANQAAGYSRFTTSPGINYYTNPLSGVPTWAIGAANNIQGAACNAAGTVYSSTSGVKGSDNTVFVCKGGSWHGVLM